MIKQVREENTGDTVRMKSRGKYNFLNGRMRSGAYRSFSMYHSCTRKMIAVILSILFLLTPLPPYSAADTVDSQYESLYSLVKNTKVEAMDIEWLVEKVYKKHSNPQKYLKKILAEFPESNMRMGRLRQAIDLMFWIGKAKNNGWTIELTNQGKTIGHMSDLDQTGWVLVSENGKLVKRDAPFREVQQEWFKYIESYGITPEKPDMMLFSGDEMVPDWTNAKMESIEFTRELAKQIVELRKNGEAYWVPGANKSQVHNRALQEGRTIQITWHDGKPYINGKPFDLQEFINNPEYEIFVLPTSVVAERYRGVRALRQGRLALGKLGENARRYMQHLDDYVKKYGNRWLEAIRATTGAGDIGPSHEPLSYMKVHMDAYIHKYGNLLENKMITMLSEASVEAYKRKFIGQAYGFDPKDDPARYEKIKDIIDRAMDIELDKVLGVKEPQQIRAREHFKTELEEVRRNPNIQAKDRLKAAEELFVKKHLEVLLEATPRVLKLALEQDLTEKGRSQNKSDFGKNHLRSLRKLFAERLVEIAGIFEAVEAIGSEAFRKHTGMSIEEVETLRENFRQKLLEVTSNIEGAKPKEIARMNRILKEMALLAKYQAIDIWLEKMAKTGRPPSVEEAIAIKRGWIEGVEPNIEKKAMTVEDEIALQRAKEWTLRKLGASRGPEYSKAMKMFNSAIETMSAKGQKWIKDSLQNISFLIVTNAALNLIRTYQVDCVLFGKTGWDCSKALVQQGTYDMLFLLRYVGESLLIGTSLHSINEGHEEGIVPLAAGMLSLLGYPQLMHLVFLNAIRETGIYVTYGFVVALHENDLITQAFKSFPQPGKPAKRSGDRGSINAQTPYTPIMWEVDVPANHWSYMKKRRVAREQFGTVISKKLAGLGLKPHQSEWRRQENDMLNQFAFDLPYYQRMSKVYEHFSPEIKRYVDHARSRGMELMDSEDSAFEVFDVCIEYEKKQSGQGECSPDTSMYPKCLAKAVAHRSPILDAFFNKYLERWLASQYEYHPGYRDNFYTLWERMSGGKETKIEIFKQLRAALQREYILGEYRHRKSDDMLILLKCHLMEAVKQAEKEKVLNKAIIAGQDERNKAFGEAYIKGSYDLYKDPVEPVVPEITLNLPEWAVRLGEKVNIEVEVRGEFDPTASSKDKVNLWEVGLDIERSCGYERPPGLIITKALIKDLNKNGEENPPKFITIEEKITAVLKNKEGEFLGKEEGSIYYYDYWWPSEEDVTEANDQCKFVKLKVEEGRIVSGKNK